MSLSVGEGGSEVELLISRNGGAGGGLSLSHNGEKIRGE